MVKSNMNNQRYLYVVGYGWSGSSAVIDLLKEYDIFFVPNLEFRLIKERYGLMNLETMLTEQWDPIETDIAIKDFLWLTKKLNEKITRFYIHFGHCYSQTIGEHFLDVTEEYVKNFVSYKFRSTWHYFYWRLNVFHRLYYWLRRKLGLGEYMEDMYFTCPISKEEFEEKTRNYIDNIFTPMIKGEDKIIVLDQGVPAHNPEYAFRYTNNAKVIVIDRDPRDVYVDLVNCKELIGAELSKKDDADIFIEWYKALHFRNRQINQKDVLFIKFEDIVLNYEETVKTIEKYIGVSPENHVKKMMSLKPDVSKNNIGKWKIYKNQEVIKKIEEELKEFCYNQ